MHGSQTIYAIAFILLQGCDPTLAALFTPARPELGRYEVCSSAESIERVIAADGSDQGGSNGSPEGVHYDRLERVEPLDAFGTAGPYDAGKLLRLYGGLRPQVARGWRQDGDRFESVTLISPYPDASLEHLQPGTLVIRWII